MKRLAVLSGLLLVGVISVAVARQQPQPGQPAQLEIQQVKDKLYMITGGGGATAAFITEKGVVVVDTKLRGNGPGILEKIKSVTPKPVIMVINTHTHGDHVGSNDAFTGAVEFIAHENCKARMETMPAFQSEEGKKFLPGKTYKDKLSLLKGADKIDLYYFGRGHTGGDTFIVFPALKVMHSGDIFAGKGTPIMDTNNGGSGLDYPKTLAKAAAGIKGVETVIPGHSSLMTWNDFKEYGDFIRDLVAAVGQAKKDGKDVDKAAADIKMPEKYSSYNMARLKSNITAIYAELNQSSAKP
ncbi:MAG TPA: MBL fold metallo-hydrolase [Blastocatellia bacterium]|nr:MBL fold metallo-hydrolase [Blastocatellia bacterium]